MAKESPKIVIIAGPNGAGKSTLAPYLLRDTYGLLEFVNADVIAAGLSAFQPEKAALEAGKTMLKRLKVLAQQREDFAFETTLATRSYASWIKELKQEGYTFHLLFLWLRNSDLAIQRVKERVRAGGHNIPEEVIRRRFKIGVKNFFNLYQQIANTWGIYYNSEINEPKIVASGKSNLQINIYQQHIWDEFKEVINE